MTDKLTPEQVAEMTARNETDGEWFQRYAHADIAALLASHASLVAELAETAARHDAQMERVKACEHIAEGEEGWEALRNECPSTAAVASLRDAFVAELKAREWRTDCEDTWKDGRQIAAQGQYADEPQDTPRMAFVSWDRTKSEWLDSEGWYFEPTHFMLITPPSGN